MTTKQEIIKTMNSLAVDYSALISECKKCESLPYFCESFPQPKLFKKASGESFSERDCEKMINGRYKLNGEKISVESSKATALSKTADDDYVELVFDSNAAVQQTASEIGIKAPVKREIKETRKPIKPSKPIKYKVCEFPFFTMLSAVALILFIVSIILLSVTGAKLSSIEKQLERARAQVEEIDNLLSEYEFQSWASKVGADVAYMTYDDIGIRWDSDVYPIFAAEGYPLQFNDGLLDVVEENLYYSGTLNLKAFTSATSKYMAERFIVHDENIFVDQFGVYYIDADYYNPLKSAKTGYWVMFALSLVGGLVLCIFNGGIIGFIINLIKLPKEKARYLNALNNYEKAFENYQIALAEYEKNIKREVAVAQAEYDAELKDYENKIDTIKRNHKNEVIKEIGDYLITVKAFLEKRKKHEQENKDKKAMIKKSYDAIAAKIKAYPETVPPKYLKVPDFNDASSYILSGIHTEITAILDILESGRADTLKEAANFYVTDKQTEWQKELLEFQKCAASLCLSCRHHGSTDCEYSPDREGGCWNYSCWNYR